MKKLFSKKFLSAILASTVLSTSLLAGCGSASGSSSGASSGGSTGSAGSSASSSEISIATVNNNDMIVMEDLTSKFTEKTGIKVKYTTLSENEIRSKIKEDVGMGGGQYDIITLGAQDSGVYLDNGWTTSLDPMFKSMSAADQKSYALDDIFPVVKESLSSTKKGLGALPFYAETTLLFYNKDIFASKSLTMPENPTWDQVYDLAVKCNDSAKGVKGIAIRGLPGSGQNMFIFSSIAYAFGAKYYDKSWNATFNSTQMKNAIEFYKKILTNAGESGATTCGYTECLNLMSTGKAAMWYDASVSAGTMANSKDSTVKGKIGYAMAPLEVKKDQTNTIGGWGLAITSASKKKDAAFKFLTWATSKEYVNLVGETKGWASAPSGTRQSTYDNANYKKACDFADITKKALLKVNYKHPAIDETPYAGNSIPTMPEYSSWGETVAQLLASYLTGKTDINGVLSSGQKTLETVATEGNYKS
jgi:sorbitol/mannitol transport system substrate-binding protein